MVRVTLRPSRRGHHRHLLPSSSRLSHVSHCHTQPRVSDRQSQVLVGVSYQRVLARLWFDRIDYRSKDFAYRAVVGNSDSKCAAHSSSVPSIACCPVAASAALRRSSSAFSKRADSFVNALSPIDSSDRIVPLSACRV